MFVSPVLFVLPSLTILIKHNSPRQGVRIMLSLFRSQSSTLHGCPIKYCEASPPILCLKYQTFPGQIPDIFRTQNKSAHPRNRGKAGFLQQKEESSCFFTQKKHVPRIRRDEEALAKPVHANGCKGTRHFCVSIRKTHCGTPRSGRLRVDSSELQVFFESRSHRSGSKAKESSHFSGRVRSII